MLGLGFGMVPYLAYEKDRSLAISTSTGKAPLGRRRSNGRNF